MPDFDKHIFICGNQRPAWPSPRMLILWQKPELQKLFKQKLAEHRAEGEGSARIRPAVWTSASMVPISSFIPTQSGTDTSPKGTWTRLLTRTSSAANRWNACAWRIPASIPQRVNTEQRRVRLQFTAEWPPPRKQAGRRGRIRTCNPSD